MKRWFLISLLTASCLAQTWTKWNDVTVGSSAGNVSSMNGITIGTSAGNYASWNNLNSPGGAVITPLFVSGEGSSSTLANSTGTTVNICPTSNFCAPVNSVLAGNLLLFPVQYSDVSTTITPSDYTCNSSGCTAAGDTCAMIGSSTAAINSKRGIVGYCKNVTAGVNYIRLSFSTDAAQVHAKVLQFSKVNLTTPIDTSSPNTNAGSTTVQAGSITPGAANKYLVMVGFRTQTPKSGACGVGVGACFIAGTGQTGITWAPLLQDTIDGTFVQGGLYTSGSAITPQFTMADSSGYAAIAVMLNTAAAGNDRGSGLQIARIIHENEPVASATNHYQITTEGNFIGLSAVPGFGAGSNHITGVTDSDSCTWAQGPAGAIGTSGDGETDFWYCANSTPNVAKLIDVAMTGTATDYTFHFYDVLGVATSSPISAEYAYGAGGVSTTSAVSSFSIFPPLVPANTDGLAIMNCGEAVNTFQSFNTPTAAIANPTLFGGENISGGGTHPPDENNCFGYLRTTDGTTAQVWNLGWPTSLTNNLVYRVTYIKSSTATVNGTTAPFTVDNFTRADDTLLGGTGNVGAAVYAAEFGRSSFKIVSNVATPNSLSSDGGTVDIRKTFSNDQWAQVKFGTITGGSSSGGQGIGVLLRASSSARTEYRCVANAAATNNIQCGKYVTGTFTALKTCSANTAPVATDTLYIQVSGSSFTFKQNGSTISACAFTDSSIASGSPGLGYSSTLTGGTISEFRDGNI